MPNIEAMSFEETQSLLQSAGFGHLGCIENGRPYIVPMHYAYDLHTLYFFTTEGTKTDAIAAHLEICLQIEEVHDPSNWRSVIATGKAEKITQQEDREHAMQFIAERNPTLTPAINKMWVDAWGRANIVAIYRIRPHMMSGRKTLAAGETRETAALDRHK